MKPKQIAKPADIAPTRGIPKFVAAMLQYSSFLLRLSSFLSMMLVGALSASDLPSVFVTEPVLENM